MNKLKEQLLIRASELRAQMEDMSKMLITSGEKELPLQLMEKADNLNVFLQEGFYSTNKKSFEINMLSAVKEIDWLRNMIRHIEMNKGLSITSFNNLYMEAEEIKEMIKKVRKNKYNTNTENNFSNITQDSDEL